MVRNLKKWMGDLRDDQASVADVSIPGTHQSLSLYGEFAYAQCQEKDLKWQLDNGVRYFDV